MTLNFMLHCHVTVARSVLEELSVLLSILVWILNLLVLNHFLLLLLTLLCMGWHVLVSLLDINHTPTSCYVSSTQSVCFKFTLTFECWFMQVGIVLMGLGRLGQTFWQTLPLADFHSTVDSKLGNGIEQNVLCWLSHSVLYDYQLSLQETAAFTH